MANNNLLMLIFAVIMNKYVKFFCVLFIGAIATNANAQCLTDQLEADYMKKHPEAEVLRLQMESYYQDYKNSPSANIQRRATYIIPVVFHVIHNGGEENISRAQILDQLRVLNEDFQRQNADSGNLRTYFKGRASNLNVEFRLATIDPSGNCFDGINRVQSNLTFEAGEGVKSLPGVQWTYTKYLNIYTVSSIESGGANGTILGYARFPWATGQSQDGILVRADRVGTIGIAVADGGGRTLTHEVGHWLGLMHPFQGGCTNSSFSSDQVDDTPPVSEQFSNSNCPSNGNSCNNDSPDELDLWENYMDYSRGTCQNMFTAGQKARTDAYLTSTQSPRRLNVSNTNLVATGVNNSNVAPVPYFYADRRVVCLGENVQLFDGSCKGTVTSRQWTVEGATVSTTNAENFATSWNTPGKYKVSLKVTNAIGSNTTSVENYIEVLPGIGQVKNPVFENFEQNNVQTSPLLFKSASGTQFTYRTDVGEASSNCIAAEINGSTPLGSIFTLETNSIDLSQLRGLNRYFSFSTAYARQTTSSSEELRVFLSQDCGGSWQQLFFRSATGLGKNTPMSIGFKPTNDNQWFRQVLYLPENLLLNDSNFKMRIEITANGGNPVFVDNINCSQFTTSVDYLNESKAEIFPVPATNFLNVTTVEKVNGLSIVNALGVVIYEESLMNNNNALKNHKIDVSNFPNGVYIVQFTTDNNTFAQKIIINR